MEMRALRGVVEACLDPTQLVNFVDHREIASQSPRRRDSLGHNYGIITLWQEKG